MMRGIKWLRVAAIVALLSGALAVWLVMPIAASPRGGDAKVDVSQDVATDDEQRGILRLVIEKASDEVALPPGSKEVVSQQKRLLLFNQSVVICRESERSSRQDECSAEVSDSVIAAVDSHIPKALAYGLVAGSDRAYAVPDPGSGKVVMVNSKDIREILTTGGWKRFYELHPDAAGFLSTTRAVLSADKMHALIYVEYGCGEVCGAGYLDYMSRINGSWKVEFKHPLWVS